jgi:hypothetical protein
MPTNTLQLPTQKTPTQNPLNPEVFRVLLTANRNEQRKTTRAIGPSQCNGVAEFARIQSG